MCPSDDELDCKQDNTSNVVGAFGHTHTHTPCPCVFFVRASLLAPATPVCPSPQCYSGGSAVACTDCYASLGNTCGSGSISCTPRVHVAWKGTDRLGRPLSSAGSILSQFRSNALSGLAGQLYKQIEDIITRSSQSRRRLRRRRLPPKREAKTWRVEVFWTKYLVNLNFLRS